ncbi:MAG: hypothetical protein WCR52_06375 [Bacteroidota bacterium]
MNEAAKLPIQNRVRKEFGKESIIYLIKKKGIMAKKANAASKTNTKALTNMPPPSWLVRLKKTSIKPPNAFTAHCTLNIMTIGINWRSQKVGTT